MSDALGRYLANRPPGPPAPPTWHVDRCPAAELHRGVWTTVRRAEGPAAAVAAEIRHPAPGEFLPHDLVRIWADGPGNPPSYWYVRGDDRVAPVPGETLSEWRSADTGARLLGIAALAGVDRAPLAAVAAELLRRGAERTGSARPSILAALGDGPAAVDLAALAAQGRRPRPESRRSPGGELAAAARSLGEFLGEPRAELAAGHLGQSAQSAANAEAYLGDGERERDRAQAAAEQWQANRVRAEIPLAAVLEALTERPPP